MSDRPSVMAIHAGTATAALGQMDVPHSYTDEAGNSVDSITREYVGRLELGK
jgi:hypothetical protein